MTKKTQNPDPNKESLLEFPCRFPIKAMGRNSDDFENVVVAIVLNHAELWPDEPVAAAPGDLGLQRFEGPIGGHQYSGVGEPGRVRTEAEALLLEANLIKRFRPRFNVLMRDDKSFPYILIADTNDAPQIVKHRGA